MMRVFAQSLTLPDGTTLTGPTNFTTIGGVLSKAIPMVIAIAGFLLLVMIIASGLALLMSAGDAKQMEKGKQQLTFAIVGFLFVIGSVFIVKVIGIVLGIREINQMF